MFDQKLPFRALFLGPSGSGKSSLLFRMIDNKIISLKPIRWVYGVYSSSYDTKQNEIQFTPNMPTEEELDQLDGGLLVLDDVISECAKSSFVADLFMRYSHHKNFSICLTAQNVFFQGSQMRNIQLNATHIVLMGNPRGTQQVEVLGRQIFNSSKFLLAAFNDATKDKQYGYLVIDFTEGEQCMRVYTDMFPGQYKKVYVPNGTSVPREVTAK